MSEVVIGSLGQTGSIQAVESHKAQLIFLSLGSYILESVGSSSQDASASVSMRLSTNKKNFPTDAPVLGNYS